MITKKDVFKLLKSFDIKHDDCVVVHTSLKHIGGIDGGAEAMLDAFCEYLYDGLFVVPTHTWRDVNASNPYYDVRSSVPCIGVFPQICAKEALIRDNAERSLHPTHSVAVFGKRAYEFVKGEESSSTPTPVGCVWARLYDENAAILMIGVGLERNTYFHAIDEMIDLPHKINEKNFRIEITKADGSKVMSPMFGTHSTENSKYFPNYKKPLDYFGVLRYGTLGDADVTCCRTKNSTEIIKKLWKKADYDLCLTEREIPEEYYK